MHRTGIGGKGATSRKTPTEIVSAGEKFPLSPDPRDLVYLSRLTAKIDNNAIQDGFQLYHHNFFFTLGGSWAVVQQRMNERFARRYHWYSAKVCLFYLGALEPPKTVASPLS